MPCINIQIDPVGPLLDIGVAPPASLQKSGSAPATITYFKALALAHRRQQQSGHPASAAPQGLPVKLA